MSEEKEGVNFVQQENALNLLGLYTTKLWPLGVYFILVVLMVVAIIVLSYFLGQRHSERATGQPFESGMIPTGSARLRFSASFYLVAMLFVIFDLESVFLFAWAVSARELGWPGYIEVLVFIGILVAALGYLWRVGALDVTTASERNVE
jgi:NADH-quinone oxidoreductase subunit A